MKRNSSFLSYIFVLLIFSNNIYSNNPISGAFGIQLGEYFNPESAIGTGSLTDGTIMYQFQSEKPFRSFSRYYVLITPKTNKVYSIWGIGDMDSDGKCGKEQDLLMAILTKKYRESDNQGAMDSFMDIEKIDIGNKRIVTKCSGYSDVTIDIRYYDDELQIIAEEERIELESEKLDSSGL